MIKEFFSTIEVAKILGVSRVAVFKKIKSGKIKAEKMGRNFVVRKENLPNVLNQFLSNEKKREIENSVKKTLREYGQTIKLLGKE